MSSSLLRRLFLLALVTPLAGVMTAACGDDDQDPPPDGGSTSIIAGVTSSLAAVSSVNVQATVNGEVVRQDTVPAVFPLELPIENLSGGDRVGIALEAVLDGTGVVASKTASTDAVEGQALLLPLRFDTACLVTPSTQSCPAGQTCELGVCVDEYVDPASLDAYTPDWATGGGQNDVCKSADSTPEVFVGEGQGDYLALDENDVVQVEAGPQGGYHIWVAVRMRGLLRSGSITTVEGTFTELGYSPMPFNVIFSYDQDEGGFCKLFALRFRLDDATMPIEQLLNQPLALTVTVIDPDDAVGTGTVNVITSDTIEGL